MLRVLGQVMEFPWVVLVVVKLHSVLASQPLGVAVAFGSHGTSEGIRLGFRPESFGPYASDRVGGLLTPAKRSLEGARLPPFPVVRGVAHVLIRHGGAVRRRTDGESLVVKLWSM